MTEWRAPTRYHWRHAAKLDIAGLRQAVKATEGFNAKAAVLITHSVGTMACAYSFMILALLSLPAVLTSGNFVPADAFPSWLVSLGLIALIAWVSQAFLQLALLPIIMVGQQVQSLAADARAEKTFADTEAILNLLNLETEGGLREVLVAIERLRTQLTGE
jgi:hypothetical protein